MPFAAARLKSGSATTTSPLELSLVRSVPAAVLATAVDPKSSTLTTGRWLVCWLVCAFTFAIPQRSRKTTHASAKHLRFLCLFVTTTMIESIHFVFYFRGKTNSVQLVRFL